jgi:hypothetical protein
MGGQNVHDESYRKAGKLDVSDFATGFSIERSGLVDVIRSELFEGPDSGMEVEAKLYKLNVYGKLLASGNYTTPLFLRILDLVRERILLQVPQRYSTREDYVWFPRGRVPFQP